MSSTMLRCEDCVEAIDADLQMGFDRSAAFFWDNEMDVGVGFFFSRAFLDVDGDIAVVAVQDSSFFFIVPDGTWVIYFL